MQSRTRCLAIGSVFALLALASAPRLPAQTGTVRCESRETGRQECPIDRGARVELTRQLSQTQCRQNGNWGFTQNFIWVSAGCRADFAVSAGRYPPSSQGNAMATPQQLRACRTEADRRLPQYSYAQIQTEPESREGSIARVRWQAGSTGGICTVAANGRIIHFTTGPAEAGGGHVAPVVTRVTCESKSAGRQECAIPEGARVRLLRQLSTNECRLNDTYGSGAGYLWVAKGCRGEFEVTQGGTGWGQITKPSQSVRTTRLTCESRETERSRCPVPGISEVRLVRQLSTNPCRLNQTFGASPGAMWVSKGCRGEFEATLNAAGNGAGAATPLPGNTGEPTALPAPVDTGGAVGRPGGMGGPDRVTCESKNGERTECPIRTAGQARLARQLGTSPCTLGTTWGFASGVIWVTKGCRGEFLVR